MSCEVLPSDADDTSIEWSVVNGAGSAEINQDGLLIGKKKGTVTVRATAKDGSGVYGEKEISVLQVFPATKVTVLPTSADMLVGETMQLTNSLTPSNSTDIIVYSGANDAVATVNSETGEVTAVSPGTVKIRATATSGKYAECTVKVYTVAPDYKKLSAELAPTVPAIGLQCGETVDFEVSAVSSTETLLLNEEAGDAAGCALEFQSSKPDLATVDADGIVTANSTGKTGTVRITAKLVGDPMNRSVYKDIKIIPRQSASAALAASAETQDFTGAEFFDDIQTVSIDAAAIKEVVGGYRLRIAATLSDSDGNEIVGGTVKWATADSSIATVATDKATGDAIVTVTGKKSGECAVTATTNDLAKNTSDYTIRVCDYAPRMEVTSVTLNPWLEEGVDVSLLPSYNNAITSIALKVPVTANRQTT